MATNGMTNGTTNGIENGHSSLTETLRSADKMVIHGGNISNWNRTKRKTTADSSDELSEVMETTLNCFVPLTKLPKKQGRKTVRFVNDCFMEKVQPDERVHLKITAKIFACALQPSLIRDSIFRAMLELGVDSFETLLLTIPEIADPEESFTAIKSFWLEMEQLFDSGYVKTLGVCDLDKNALERLYDWARDLVEYSNAQDIQLLTHADPRDILTEEQLQSILSDVSDEINTGNWRPVWALRYSVLVKCRGVIKNKAYIVSCERTHSG